jgi:hypothetical protein
MTQGKPPACALRIGQRRGRSACTCAWALRVRCTRQGSPPTPLTRQSTPAAAPRCWQTGGDTRPPWREVRNLRSCSGTLSPRMAKAHHQRVRPAPFFFGVPDHLIRRPVPPPPSPPRRNARVRVATRARMFAPLIFPDRSASSLVERARTRSARLHYPDILLLLLLTCAYSRLASRESPN